MWPWKRDDSSPASFEKTLSRVSEQITKSNIRLDTFRSKSRRVKALWTLYTSIAYLIYTLILTLVLGARNWSVAHYSGLLGAPIVIYGVRKAAAWFYDWRVTKEQAYLEELQKQRDTTIEKLKTATKYNSTQQLLDKYGGSTPKSTPSGKGKTDPSQKKKTTPTSNSKQQQPPIGRTGIPPPPTANIPNRSPPTANLPSTPIRPPTSSAIQSSESMPFQPDEPGFAPNAFTQFPSSSQTSMTTPHWYDRLFDILLGEDETQAKNRVVLLCSHCRLVNGQGPPGVKSLEEIGKWRCGGCGAWNGEESEAKKILEAVKTKEEKDKGEGWEVVSKGDEQEQIGRDGTVADVSASEKGTKKGKAKRNVIPSSDGEDEDEDDETEEPPAAAAASTNDEDTEEQDEEPGSTAIRKRKIRRTAKPS